MHEKEKKNVTTNICINTQIKQSIKSPKSCA